MVAVEAQVFQGQCYFQKLSPFLFVFSFSITVSLDIIHISEVHPFKLYSVVFFSIFTELFIHHHYLIPEHVITPKRNLVPTISNHSPLPYLLALVIANLVFVSMDVLTYTFLFVFQNVLLNLELASLLCIAICIFLWVLHVLGCLSS